MSALAVEADAWEDVCLGPQKFAKRLATYISDPARIRLLTVREFGVANAPSVARCAELRAAHERRCTEFRELSERNNGAENDNGEVFKVKGLIRQCKPKPKLLPVRIRIAKPDGRPANLVIQRAKADARRKAMAINSGPTARNIIAATAGYFGLTPDDIVGEDRRRYIVSARHVAMRLLSEALDAQGKARFSKAHIGRILGGRDHTSVIHALGHFDHRAQLCPVMADAYKALSHG